MFKEFLNDKRNNLPESKDLDFRRYVETITRTFDELVDFLRDPERFPNREINDATSLMWNLIGNKDIPVVLDQWGVTSLVFMVVGDEVQRYPVFIMPVDFIDQVRENPTVQLGGVAYMASQARDYYSGALNPTNSKIVNRRARAFEAEALLTIKKMALEEGVTIEWDNEQRSVLAESPLGLKSLSPELNYKTPEYRIQNFKNN